MLEPLFNHVEPFLGMVQPYG